MFKKILFKAVVGAAATGTALSVSLVATPSVVTSAPEISNVACAAYPGSVATNTDLSVAQPIVRYGRGSTATAKVARTDSGAKKPIGTVTFTLSNKDGSVRRTWTRDLNRGEATISLPSRLPARATYGLRVAYNATNCSMFADSNSEPRGFTVLRAGTKTNVAAPNRDRGERPVVRVAVNSGSPVATSGRARVKIYRKAVLVRSRLVSFTGGFRTSFAKLRPGYYDVRVQYLGTGNFVGSRGSDDFRVFR